MNSRQAKIERITKETQIKININIDGTGKNSIQTGFGMLDHMLDLLAFWANFDLELECKGDLHIDAHHSCEDIGLALGSAIDNALADRKAINRIGYGRVPMDEALCEVTVDLSGRAYLVWRGDEILPPVMAGEEKDIWREFYKALAQNLRSNIHVNFLYGLNGHHLLESVAKGLGVALCDAIKLNTTNTVRSTKGSLL